MININFGSLFTIELLHKFYSDQLCPDFTITPTILTQQVISGNKAIARQYKNQLIGGIQCDGISSPLKTLSPVATGMQMTFFMTLNNPLFVNYTNLPSASSSSTIYYFTNRNSNPGNGKNFLSSKIPAYNSATPYLPGSLVVDGSSIVFSAIKSNNSGSPFDTSHSDYWTRIDNNQYPTTNDILTWLPSISTYKFPSAQTSAAISVLGYNTASDDYTKSYISTNINLGALIPSFTLDLSVLAPGKYSLSVNGSTPQWIYINDELNSSSTFGVIDIFNDATPASCQLVDTGQNVFSPIYSIYFLNRATIWKYTLKSDTAGTLIDSTTPATIHYQFDNNASPNVPSVFLSKTPIPLSDTALTLTLTLSSNNYAPIACASPQRLTNIVLTGDSYSCSEIFLNY